MAFIVFCFKCRSKEESNNLEAVKMKNGKDAVRGKCHKCGTTTFKIGKLPQ